MYNVHVLYSVEAQANSIKFRLHLVFGVLFSHYHYKVSLSKL